MTNVDFFTLAVFHPHQTNMHPTTLFVYGTLMFPELRTALAGRDFESEPALAQQYRRSMIFGEDNIPYHYPALVPDETHEVQGLLLHDIDQESFSKLSFFEEEKVLYDLRPIQVTCRDTTISTHAFYWIQSRPEKLEGVWDSEWFTKQHFTQYAEVIIPETLAQYRENYGENYGR